MLTPYDPKPKFRGISHLVAAVLALPAAGLLISSAMPGHATLGAAVYATSFTLLFATSATYHVPMWPLSWRAWFRRADHSAIYVLIAGSYTPGCLVALPDDTGRALLVTVWTVAALGVAKSFFWTNAPRWLNAGVYVVFGWLIVPFLPQLYQGGGGFFVLMMAIGGAFYTFGAVIYAKKWFNGRKDLFGYHEVFHLFVVAAAGCHYAGMWSLVA